MNSLSWFLYLADVLPRLGQLLSVASVLFLIFAAIGTVIWWCSTLDCGEEHMKPRWPLIRRAFAIAVPIAVLSMMLPSQRTIYLIAGSEAGESVVASEEGREILADVREIIKLQLKKVMS